MFDSFNINRSVSASARSARTRLRAKGPKLGLQGGTESYFRTYSRRSSNTSTAVATCKYIPERICNFVVVFFPPFFCLDLRGIPGRSRVGAGEVGRGIQAEQSFRTTLQGF